MLVLRGFTVGIYANSLYESYLLIQLAKPLSLWLLGRGFVDSLLI